MLIAKMDASTVPLSTMTSEPTELTEGLGRLVATDTRADLHGGLAFALDVLRGATRPEGGAMFVISLPCPPESPQATMNETSTSPA